MFHPTVLPCWNLFRFPIPIRIDIGIGTLPICPLPHGRGTHRARFLTGAALIASLRFSRRKKTDTASCGPKRRGWRTCSLFTTGSAELRLR